MSCRPQFRGGGKTRQQPIAAEKKNNKSPPQEFAQERKKGWRGPEENAAFGGLKRSVVGLSVVKVNLIRLLSMWKELGLLLAPSFAVTVGSKSSPKGAALLCYSYLLIPVCMPVCRFILFVRHSPVGWALRISRQREPLPRRGHHPHQPHFGKWTPAGNLPHGRKLLQICPTNRRRAKDFVSVSTPFMSVLTTVLRLSVYLCIIFLRCIPSSLLQPKDRPLICHVSEKLMDQFQASCCDQSDHCNHNLTLTFKASTGR